MLDFLMKQSLVTYINFFNTLNLLVHFTDNGDLRCPGSVIHGSGSQRKRQNLLKRFGVTVATLFHVNQLFHS